MQGLYLLSYLAPVFKPWVWPYHSISVFSTIVALFERKLDVAMFIGNHCITVSELFFALSLYVGVNDFSQRSHSCGEFRPSHIGEEVKICGWVQYKRLMFLIVRDWSGTVQVLLPESMVNGLFIWCIQREDMGKKRIYDRRVYNTKWAKLKIAWA